MANLLLIEDDEMLGLTIKDNLVMDGHVVTWKEGLNDLSEIDPTTYDAIVLDVMLPGKNGFEILQHIRISSQVPVLMISARGSSADRIKGLELKADDYLAKPFELKEFQLRLERLLRNSPSSAVPQVIGKAKFNYQSMEIISEGQSIPLSLHECKVLRFLVSNPNRVLSRDEIISAAWPVENPPSTRTIDNFIVKFRKIIEQDPSQPKIILSQRGLGYKFVPQE